MNSITSVKMMSSQAVPDRVNKYRYGVLIGNFAEEAFGLDHANKVLGDLT